MGCCDCCGPAREHSEYARIGYLLRITRHSVALGIYNTL